MLGSNPGPLQQVHWQSDALTTRLDLIRHIYNIIASFFPPAIQRLFLLQVRAATPPVATPPPGRTRSGPASNHRPPAALVNPPSSLLPLATSRPPPPPAGGAPGSPLLRRIAGRPRTPTAMPAGRRRPAAPVVPTYRRIAIRRNPAAFLVQASRAAAGKYRRPTGILRRRRQTPPAAAVVVSAMADFCQRRRRKGGICRCRRRTRRIRRHRRAAAIILTRRCVPPTTHRRRITASCRDGAMPAATVPPPVVGGPRRAAETAAWVRPPPLVEFRVPLRGVTRRRCRQAVTGEWRTAVEGVGAAKATLLPGLLRNRRVPETFLLFPYCSNSHIVIVGVPASDIDRSLSIVSVADPDPYVFGPTGSGSVSQRFGSGAFCHKAKIVP
jgi:hypothetical protein